MEFEAFLAFGVWQILLQEGLPGFVFIGGEVYKTYFQNEWRRYEADTVALLLVIGSVCFISSAIPLHGKEAEYSGPGLQTQHGE